MKFKNIKLAIMSVLMLAAGLAHASVYNVTMSKGVEKSSLSKSVTKTRYFQQSDRMHAFITLTDFDKKTWPKVLTARWYSCDKLRSVREFEPDTIESHLKRGEYHAWFWIDAAKFGSGDGRVDIYADGEQVATTNFSVLDSSGLQRSCGENNAAVAEKSEQFLLDTDALFKFNGSKPNEIYDTGLVQINDLISRIQSNYKSIDKMTVVGHTDYLGSDAYNLALSNARANTVKGLLISKGIPAERIVTLAKGESVPVKFCEAKLDKNALQGCLAPNRRVEIFVVGEKR